MKSTEKERIIERYNKRLAIWGDDTRTLASGTEERRLIRFNVLYEVGIKEGSSILDLGCGFGDFYGYLQEIGIKNIDYTGYDINPKLIEIAKQKYPAAQFDVKDIQIDSFPEFDFIVSSEAFNLKLESQNNYDFIAEMLNICYEHSRIAVAIDFLTSYVDFESAEGFHYSPEKIFTIAKQITKRVCLRHDYPIYQFCIYLYKDFKGWRQS